MTSLKDHQATMVTMLVSGTAIPTSAIRLAHAVHDILAKLNDTQEAPVAHTERRSDSTTSGLNDALLAADVAAVAPKQQSLESLLKQRDNTIRQLKGRVADLLEQNRTLQIVNDSSYDEIESLRNPEQAGCRKEDTQLADEGWVEWSGGKCPVSGDAEVQVRLLNGAEWQGVAIGYEWAKTNTWYDIRAYRVVDK